MDPAIVMALVLAASWLVPLLPAALSSWIAPVVVAAGVLWILGSLYRDRQAPRALGLRLDNVGSSTGAFLIPVLLVFAPVAIGAAPLGEELAARMARDIPSYFLWAFLQQFAAVAAFWRIFAGPLAKRDDAAVLSRRSLVAAIATGACFALAHAPNLGLMALVGIAEVIWLALFARFRNLVALAVAHAVAALLVSYLLVPSSVLESMDVGVQFFR